MAFGIALLIFCVIAIMKGIVIVPEGYECTLERLGKFTRVLNPGFHIVAPFIDTVGAKLNMKEQTLSIPPIEVLTKDEILVRVGGNLLFQIQNSVNAAYQVRDLGVAILRVAENNIQTIVGQMTKEDFISKQDVVNYKLKDIMGEVIAPWGTKIIHIKVWNMDSKPSDPFEKPTDYFSK